MGTNGGERDFTHIAIAVVLFLIAATLYALGQGAWAGLVILGAIAEIGAWALLTGGASRPYSKVELPGQAAADERPEAKRK